MSSPLKDSRRPSPKAFYCYKHFTLEDPPRCFNVGKGVKSRPTSRKRNHKWRAIVKRYGLCAEVCVGFMCHDHVPGHDCVASKDACAWEVENIALEKTYSTNHSHDDPNDSGCNFTRGGEGTVGFTHPPDVVAEAARKRTGKKRTPEQVQRLSISHQGIKLPPRSQAYRAKQSLAHTGKKLPPRAKRKPYTHKKKRKFRKQSAEHVARRMASRQLTLQAKTRA